ncbi:predicted protein [Histoplasma capsulatum H143]|uniref:Uncharacterized protein n=1 Tax=Ajellomyces capsulatus (strain H143) TaxID=544712 RepID=C6H1J4_AJECH|nr:predicted protein [Histoplasma capsulatum H143]
MPESSINDDPKRVQWLKLAKLELPYAWPFLETRAPGLESRWIKTKIFFVQWEIMLSFEFNSGAQDHFHRNISQDVVGACLLLNFSLTPFEILRREKRSCFYGNLKVNRLVRRR